MYSPVEESHARRTWYIRKAEGTVGCCPTEDRNVFNSPLSRTTRASRNQKNIPSLAAYVGGYETYYTTRFRWGVHIGATWRIRRTDVCGGGDAACRY